MSKTFRSIKKGNASVALKIERGSGNVFQDIGFAPEEAENLKLRPDLMTRIDRVRKGNVKKAQGFLKECSDALREKLQYGGVNLAYEYADYLATCLEHLAKTEDTARLFCLDMPKNRPKGTGDPAKQFERALDVLKEYQKGGTLSRAIKAVAKKVFLSEDAVRKSWKAHGLRAKFYLASDTPRDMQCTLRFPGKRVKSKPKSRR